MVVFEARLNGRRVAELTSGHANVRSRMGAYAEKEMVVTVLPREEWAAGERDKFPGPIYLTLFETQTRYSPEFSGVQAQASKMWNRRSKTHIGGLPHLVSYGQRRLSIPLKSGHFYDVFGIGEDNEERGVVAGIMRVGSVRSEDYCLTLEQAKFLAGVDILLTPKEMLGIEADVNVAAFNYNDGLTAPGMVFDFGSLEPANPASNNLQIGVCLNLGSFSSGQSVRDLMIRQPDLPTGIIREHVNRPYNQPARKHILVER
ncbi:MAG: hypothetical protein HY362_01805 [Candidatus Aenigmarchaeota archaeon]|nr:hypothetical protein [Candidatus Aenigmarchaeota archaeon]